jgi:hypothetical protein
MVWIDQGTHTEGAARAECFPLASIVPAQFHLTLHNSVKTISRLSVLENHIAAGQAQKVAPRGQGADCLKFEGGMGRICHGLLVRSREGMETAAMIDVCYWSTLVV